MNWKAVYQTSTGKLIAQGPLDMKVDASVKDISAKELNQPEPGYIWDENALAFTPPPGVTPTAKEAIISDLLALASYKWTLKEIADWLKAKG